MIYKNIFKDISNKMSDKTEWKSNEDSYNLVKDYMNGFLKDKNLSSDIINEIIYYVDKYYYTTPPNYTVPRNITPKKKRKIVRKLDFDA